MRPTALWSVAVIAGVVASIATFAFPYTFCMDGPAYGLPFAIVRPAHGYLQTAVFIGEWNRVPSEVSTFGLAGDLIVWSGLCGAALILAGRLRRRAGRDRG